MKDEKEQELVNANDQKSQEKRDLDELTDQYKEKMKKIKTLCR